MYKLAFSPKGRDALAVLDKETAQRVLVKLKWLVLNAGNLSHVRLKGEFSGLCKLKIGDWRVIYEVGHDEKSVVVHKAGHRKEVYK